MKKLTIIFSIILITFSFQTVNSQDFGLQWGAAFGSGGFDTFKKVVTDENGNIYMFGTYGNGSAIDFDPSIDVFELPNLSSSGIYFILKLSPNRELLWVKSLPSDNSNYFQINDIELDKNNNIYAVGYFSGTFDFDPGVGTSNLTVFDFQPQNSVEGFVLKLNSLGDFVWAKQVGTKRTMNSYGRSICEAISLNNLGDIFLAGGFDGVIDLDPGIDSTFTDSLYGMYISKLDSAGDLVWTNFHEVRFSGIHVSSLDLNDKDEICASGQLGGVISANTITGVDTLFPKGNEDVFISKYDSDGNLIWIIVEGGLQNDFIGNAVLDNEGYVYAVGGFKGPVDFDPGTGQFILNSVASGVDGFIQKLDSLGNLEWAQSFGAIGGDAGYSIALDQFGNLTVVGGFSYTVDFDFGIGVNEISSIGESDAFVEKLSPLGELLWVKSFGSSKSDFAADLALNNSGDIYVIGSFIDTIDLDPGPKEINYHSRGVEDIFLVKLSTTGLSTPELNNNLKVILYPNPASSKVMIENKTKEMSTITIINAMGEKVYSSILASTITTLNISDFAKGVYFVSINTKKSSRVEKLMVE